MSTEPVADKARSPLPMTLAFSVGLILVFTLVTYILPQVEGEAPKETEVDLDSLTMDDFVALGQDLFEGKGTCTLCHKPPPMGRAPDVQGEDLVAAANERLADPRYQGAAKDAAAYIHESMVDPSAYVVAGWGQKGSNDTVSPMPAVDKPPLLLTVVEIDAIIAYMQSKDGNDITVELPTGDAAPLPVAEAGGAAPAPAKTAGEAIAKYGCQACHSVLGTESAVGPSLADVGARLDVEPIRQSIIDPDAVIVEGFDKGMMPQDFADKMTVRELQMIVQFLAGSK
jgi:mono/diheme cytochrome c family protein